MTDNPGPVRDYLEWHQAYDDPASDLSWRLSQVQAYIRSALDQIHGQATVLSLCAGDGRDVLQVLAERGDSSRIKTTLIELHPVLAQRAREFAAKAGLANVTVRTVDAGNTAAYADVVPADLVIMIGIFGNISTDDLRRTICTTVVPTRCDHAVVAKYGRPRREQPGPWLADRSWLPRVGLPRIRSSSG